MLASVSQRWHLICSQPSNYNRKIHPVPSDEQYVIDTCDEILIFNARRQYRFDFLIGLPSLKTNRRAKLPVDAFYPELNLVVEYRERQHTEPVTFWDTKPTACGLQRGEQRKQYDELRRVVLKDRGYHLVEIDFFDLAHDARKRLIRDISKDKVTKRAKLAKFLGT
jgi:predicted nucleic acid-binding Zn ribbon protein